MNSVYQQLLVKNVSRIDCSPFFTFTLILDVAEKKTDFTASMAALQLGNLRGLRRRADSMVHDN